MSVCATIDFETRSAVSLQVHGPWRYVSDPTTDVLCMAFRLPHWSSGHTALWTPTTSCEELQELFVWIQYDKGLVEAHNVWFEVCVWRCLMEARYEWPTIAPEQWRCSMAKASTHALPRSLEGAADALGLDIVKDKTARPLLLKMTKPRKPLKKELVTWEAAGKPTVWHEAPEQLERLYAYCRQDVLAEEALSEALPDLSPEEQRMFTMDLNMNLRGFQLDSQAVKVALKRIAVGTKALNAELAALTKRKATRVSQRTRLLTWLQAQKVDISDTQSATVNHLLESSLAPLPPPARRALEILSELGRSSTAKYAAMRDWQSAIDHRVRGGLLYHGASTGRWTGRGVQPHNFPKGSIGDQMDAAWTRIKDPTQEVPLGYLAEALRGAIVSRPGTLLYVADYAAIEARVLHWLAGDAETLDVFRTGADLYCEFASEVFGRAITKENVKERQLGKIAVLGLGYQMGAAKFQATCESYKADITVEMAQTVVDAYRTKFWKVKQLWADMQAAAVTAVQSNGEAALRGIRWLPKERFLYAELPSGRRLAYADPVLRKKQTPWGSAQTVLTYMGIDTKTHQWVRQATYGGMIVENLVQAMARDIMAHALLTCAEGGRYDPVLSVHDEIVCEGHPAWTSLDEFVDLVTDIPEWASGLPIVAEGWTGMRYRK